MTDKTTKNDDGSTTVVRETGEWADTDSIPEIVERSKAAATGCKVPIDDHDYKADFLRLLAYLITKGVGHNAIKRILKGEVVG